MDQKCHINLHKSWISNFAIKKGGKEVYCLNLGNMPIGYGTKKIDPNHTGIISASKLGISINYFSEEIEHWLGDYETKFGDITHEIIQRCKNDEYIIPIKEDDKLFLNCFVNLCISRSKHFNTKFWQRPAFKDRPQDNDFLPLLTMVDMKPFLEGATLTIYQSALDKNFILPSLPLYKVHSNSFMVPLSSKIVLEFSTEMKNVIDGCIINKVHEARFIDICNKMAYLGEKNCNEDSMSFLVASNKADIEDTLQYINT